MVARALRAAGPIDHWSPDTDIPGTGPLRAALASHRWDLARAMLEKGASRKLSQPSAHGFRLSDLSATGAFQGASGASGPRSGIWLNADAKRPTSIELAALGACGLALLGGQEELARKLKPVARAGFDRDLAQLSAWLRIADDPQNSVLEVALALGEAISLSSLKIKRTPKAAADSAAEANAAGANGSAGVSEESSASSRPAPRKASPGTRRI